MNPRKFLLDRADSYGRDACVLRGDGDLPMAIAYETIRDELRRAADELTQSENDERARLRAALATIAAEDYRGNRPWSATYAERALENNYETNRTR